MEQVNNLIKGLPWYMHVVGLLSLGLIITGFFMPPMGVIDGSVLTAVGELLGGTAVFHVVAHIPEYLQSGGKATIKTQAGEIEITGKNHNKKEESIYEKEEIQ